jgi:capsular exopolysaccharide synthesis family protein
MNNNVTPTPQHVPQRQEEDALEIQQILWQLLRIWYLVLISIGIALAGAYLYLRYTVPVYEVKSKFFIKEKETPFSIFEDAIGMNTSEIGLVNQTIILKSRPIAAAALAQLDFDVEYYSKGVFITKEQYGSTPITVVVDWTKPQLCNGDIKIVWNNKSSFTLEFLEEDYTRVDAEKRGSTEAPVLKQNTFRFGEVLRLPYLNLTIALTSTEATGEMLIRLRDREGLISEYTGDNLTIQPVDKASSILELSLKTPTPAKGKEYLDRLQLVYLEDELAEKNTMSTNTIEFIDAQLVMLSDSLLYVENRLENFRSNNKIYNITTEGSAVYTELVTLERQLAQEQFKREYYSQLRQYLLREDYSEIVVPSGLGIQDPILNSLIENLLVLQAEKSMHMAKLTETAPMVRDVNRKISDMNRSIQEVLRNVDENAGLIIRDLQARIREIERDFNRLPQTEQNLLRIQREFALNESLYTYLLQKRAEAAITRASNTTSNKVIEDARPGGGPISPQSTRIYAIALMLGMIVPVGGVVAKVYLNDKLKDLGEIRKKSDVTLLAQIGFSEEQDNLLVFNRPRSGVSEAFRSLRSNINFILPKDKAAVIMLTSSISGEGKTFCSINLASVYALTGKKTILLGCDMRKPKIFGDFGLDNTKGLSSYLSGMEEKASVIQAARFENLDIIAAGPIPPNPAELLVSERMSDLLALLRTEYEVIILDCPPVGLVSESLDLMQLSDLCLFILRYNYSKKPFIDQINLLKQQQQLKNAYLVFNGLDKSANSYGYGYGYRYGYYEDSTNEKSKSWLKRLIS